METNAAVLWIGCKDLLPQRSPAKRRTALKDRKLPDYTKGEELLNCISHILGGVFGVLALVLCVVYSARNLDAWAVVGSAIYGGSMVILYTMSSIYHGLSSGMAKKVFQVIDHCSVYLLIVGSYTPILLVAIRPIAPVCSWILFGVVWGLSLVAMVFTAIDLKRYRVLSMICYIALGWCIIFATKVALEAMGIEGFLWLLAGGIAYTIGAILYGVGKKKRYMHSVFHFFVLAGSVLQFVTIYFYVLQ